MEIINKIKVYELNGEEVEIGKSVEIKIKSNWNRKSLVVLEIGKVDYTVIADELQKAIQNATNK